MVKQTIRIFCRIKPTKNQIGLYDLDEDEETNRSLLSFTIPKDIADGLINNKKENYKFLFDRIFNQTTKQDEIFENVAKPVIDSVLSGFNGTIFAYGQTGSGKTFTITGGAERFVDRGIIPRTLSYIFEQISRNSGNVYTIHISYLEIYNESGFDLLDPNHEASKLEDLPKVSLLEDNDGNIHLKNLSMHQASKEEEALNLLFLGDTNRMIAETPMNQASTRSHCIFTTHIAVRESDSATIRRAKLHLVDLAGSERVGKTGVGGILLKEAKYINLSLHFLEQVIIALSEKTRNHIPYRNSMMTSVLRDSLGGNCMTSMIATCSVEKKSIDESISTCRFAQRVAMIKNNAVLNEELDPKLMIEKLKREVQQLKDELALATGQRYESELSSEDKEKLEMTVNDFVEDPDKEAVLNVGPDMRKINYSFHLLKAYALNNKNINKETPEKMTHSRDVSPSQGQQSQDEYHNQQSTSDCSYLADTKELKKLKELIMQRDNEINILVNMLKKEKQRSGLSLASSVSASTTNTSVNKLQQSSEKKLHHGLSASRSSSGKTNIPEDELSGRENQGGGYRDHQKNANKILRDNIKKQRDQMSLGRHEAFEVFKRDYKDNGLIEENKKGLKSRYSEAKRLGEQVNSARSQINLLKTKLEKLKMRRSLQVAGGNRNTEVEDTEESALRHELESQKQTYKQSFNHLKALKTEIEHMQFLLEKSKAKLQNDFETWWAEQVARTSDQANGISADASGGSVRKAWRTPPITPQESTIANDVDDSSRTRSSRNSLSSSYSTSNTSESGGTNNPNKDYTNITNNKHSIPRSNALLSNINKQQQQQQQHSKSSSRTKTQHSLPSSTSGSNRVAPDEEQESTFTSSRHSTGRPKSSGLRLTGDPETDDDIMAFMRARQQLMNKNRE